MGLRFGRAISLRHWMENFQPHGFFERGRGLLNLSYPFVEMSQLGLEKLQA